MRRRHLRMNWIRSRTIEKCLDEYCNQLGLRRETYEYCPNRDKKGSLTSAADNAILIRYQIWRRETCPMWEGIGSNIAMLQVLE